MTGTSAGGWAVPFALRILPTMPDFEVRQIVRGAGPLEPAALRKVQEAE